MKAEMFHPSFHGDRTLESWWMYRGIIPIWPDFSGERDIFRGLYPDECWIRSKLIQYFWALLSQVNREEVRGSITQFWFLCLRSLSTIIHGETWWNMVKQGETLKAGIDQVESVGKIWYNHLVWWLYRYTTISTIKWMWTSPRLSDGLFFFAHASQVSRPHNAECRSQSAPNLGSLGWGELGLGNTSYRLGQWKKQLRSNPYFFRRSRISHEHNGHLWMENANFGVRNSARPDDSFFALAWSSNLFVNPKYPLVN